MRGTVSKVSTHSFISRARSVSFLPRRWIFSKEKQVAEGFSSISGDPLFIYHQELCLLIADFQTLNTNTKNPAFIGEAKIVEEGREKLLSGTGSPFYFFTPALIPDRGIPQQSNIGKGEPLSSNMKCPNKAQQWDFERVSED